MASRDPFAFSPDVAAYLPRDATERALALLAEAVHLADRPVVFEGPAGIGKTLLLHVLVDRLGGQVRPVAVPIPTLAPSDLWHWVASRLGIASEGDALAAIEQSQTSGAPVLLMIDDANALPEETVTSLRAALDAQMPGLRAVLVVSDDAEESEALHLALGEPVHRIRFAEAMTADECADYICARLAASDLDAGTRARFDDPMLARIHAHTHGVPAAVHELADLLVRPDAAARAHELAPELRPDIVSKAAARRSSESIDRVGEWGDEDLAKTVAGRRRAMDTEEAAHVVGVFAPDDDADGAPEPAAPAPERASSAGRIALAAGVVGLLAGVMVWQLDLFAPPTPIHVATFVREDAAPSRVDVVTQPPGLSRVVAKAPPIAAEEVAPSNDAQEEVVPENAPDPFPTEPAEVARVAESIAMIPEPVVERVAAAPAVEVVPAPEVVEKPAAANRENPKRAAVAAVPAKTREGVKPRIAAIAGRKPPSAIAVAPSAVATHLARVLAPAGTRIEIGDEVRGTAPLAAVFLVEGEHRVRWTREDGVSAEQVFRVDAANRVLDLSDSMAAQSGPPNSSQ